MTLKLRLFNIPALHDKIVEKVETFIDPHTIPAPGAVDAPAATLIYNNHVVKALPRKVSLYGGVMGHVVLDDVVTVKEEELGGEKIAVINGGLFTWIQGKSEDAVSKCEHYCDISRAYFMNQKLLGLNGCAINVPERNVNRFTRINISENPKMPVFYTLGFTGFVVKKELEGTVYTI